jgi:rfaE bifunctional protein nucleotidyltransferase chain/domain
MRNRRAGFVSGRKVKTLGELSGIIRRLRSRGKKIVFTNGCFDLLHYGHVRYLEAARNKGDILVVAVNSDASMRRIKGKLRPLVAERDRLGVIAGLASVDYALLFGEDTPLKAIRALKPDVLVKGSDWNVASIVGADFVLRNGGKVATIALVPGRSTTSLIKKIAQKCCGKK